MLYLFPEKPFEEGEDVLVESKSGKILWDAKVMVVAQDPNTHKVNGYRVHYLYWSSRFDEWVEPFRVVEPNENNLIVQVRILILPPFYSMKLEHSPVLHLYNCQLIGGSTGRYLDN